MLWYKQHVVKLQNRYATFFLIMAESQNTLTLHNEQCIQSVCYVLYDCLYRTLMRSLLDILTYSNFFLTWVYLETESSALL